MNNQIENNLINLTGSFEGCRLVPYLDSTGIPTDGYGNTHGVVMGIPITQEKADSDLLKNLRSAINAVHAGVVVPISDDEEGALVDLVFNIGAGNFRSSTLLARLNAGDYHGAATEFGKWNHSGGQVLAGLTRRRAAEADLFTKGIA